MTIKKVLATGSKGFVGRQISRRLKEVGFQVVTTAKNRKLIDLTNVDQFPTIQNGTIVYLTAKTSISDSFGEPHKAYFTNVLGTLNMLGFARIRNIKQLIYASTYVYDEPQYLPIDEKHVVNPPFSLQYQ